MVSGKDVAILNSLFKNSRKSIKEISRETGIPRATVFDRLKKLSDGKVIKYFTIEPDYEKLGFGTMAFILVKYSPFQNVPQGDVAKNISKLRGIEEVFVISGSWDIIVKARAPSLKELGELVVDQLRMVKGVSQTETCACFKLIGKNPVFL